MAVRYELFTDGSNGTVNLSSLMSADWSAMQVQAVPLNASGNYVPLTTGAVLVEVSPFDSGDYWVPVNAGSYYGLAVRARITKSSLPAGVTSLHVSIWRSGVSPMPSQILATSYAEHANKAGRLFTASRRVSPVAGGANLDSAFITGGRQVIFNQRIIGYTGRGVIASVYRAATLTGGVASEINNPNDVNPQTPTVQVLTGVTVTNIGNLTVAATYSEGNSSNQGQGNSQAKLGETIIMAPNTTYLLRITSLDTADQNINAYISWIEDNSYFA